MFASISVLRLSGLILGLLGLLYMFARRRNRLLGRMELFTLIALSAVALLALFPGAANILTRLTGFTGELSRITSLMAFAVVALVAAVAILQGQLAELRHKFHRYLRNVAVRDAIERDPIQSQVDIAIVMPAYNEADNLPEVLQLAPKQILGQTVICVVVDDGSDDGTDKVARENGAWVVSNPVNAGGGHAIHVGFLAAQRLGAKYVVTMDADGQHRFEDLEAIIQPLVETKADIVIGSRHLGESVGHEAVRAIGLRIFNWALSFITGRKVTDCSSGYRGFDMERFDRLTLLQQKHHTAEMIIEATRRGLLISEVPITILPRIHGESKKGTNWIYGLRFANTILATWWRK